MYIPPFPTSSLFQLRLKSCVSTDILVQGILIFALGGENIIIRK